MKFDNIIKIKRRIKFWVFWVLLFPVYFSIYTFRVFIFFYCSLYQSLFLSVLLDVPVFHVLFLISFSDFFFFFCTFLCFMFSSNYFQIFRFTFTLNFRFWHYSFFSSGFSLIIQRNFIFIYTSIILFFISLVIPTFVSMKFTPTHFFYFLHIPFFLPF